MSSLRVFIAIATFDPLLGGAEVQAKAQARALRERGHEATIVTLRHKLEWPSRTVITEVPVIRVAGALLSGRQRYPRPVQKMLYLLAQLTLGWTLWSLRDRYDVLHVYQLSSLAFPTALVSWLAHKPMLISVRSTGTGKTAQTHEPVTLAVGPLEPTESWLQIDGGTWTYGDLESLRRMGKVFVSLTRSLLIRTGAVVIILSTRMRDYLAANNFWLPTLRLIPNGVDINRFQPANEQDNEGGRGHIVVCVSKFRYEKGIDVLLQAWHIVHKELPHARLILVGEGPLEERLRHMVDALQLGESVEFAGRQADVTEYLHRAGIAVLPSRWEGMPNAVLEAMACGLPCVATRVSGSEDVIAHGQNGLLVESEDYNAMAGALLTFLNDPLFAQECGRRARRSIEQRYAFEHIMDEYVELYQTLLVQKNNAVTGSPSEPCSIRI